MPTASGSARRIWNSFRLAFPVRGAGREICIHEQTGLLVPARDPRALANAIERLLNIDIETCRECGGAMKVIACIEGPVVIQKILNHRKENGEYQHALRLPESRGPPQTRLFG